MKLPIYLDYHSTCPLDPRVLEEMMPFFSEHFGNASSRSHSFGWTAEQAVEKAREQIAQLIGASSKEIIFTSGATESDNLAVMGVAEHYQSKGKHIITSSIEHKAISDPCLALERKGFEITTLGVDSDGLLDLKELEKSIRPDTILVSVIAASNEIGTIQDLAGIGKLCKSKGVLFHTDAVQALGKTPIDVQAMDIDLLSISAHKIYGPKGVGALYVRRKNPRVRLAAIQHGGGHERGMRSGTLNVPGIVGLGCASKILLDTMDTEILKLRSLRDRLWQGLHSQLEDIYINGHPTKRLPNNLNVSFAYVEGESLIMGIKDLAVSSGSACTSTSLEPSYVLKAMGVGEDLAHTSIRMSVGRFTTEAEVDYAVTRIVSCVKKLRHMSPLYEMVKEGVDLKNVAWTGH